ncbi:hypothetical protein EDEG_02257 [Edhazardia aedis USNM 41457]|uniref:Uncharacterized protein n=1 Tax=Edhazardia aedis (strain USNM 41457) TaxID=1003232 RepID=J9DLD0_EDHAE|nr:hypothetical protein EDEG_02257 [Edhazardia aedis USNM 41457]|eukprot:EJW03400.1 hypothetical protein EDEG_02257 [Edhazardia aedis USNM 41457]
MRRVKDWLGIDIIQIMISAYMILSALETLLISNKTKILIFHNILSYLVILKYTKKFFIKEIINRLETNCVNLLYRNILKRSNRRKSHIQHKEKPFSTKKTYEYGCLNKRIKIINIINIIYGATKNNCVKKIESVKAVFKVYLSHLLPDKTRFINKIFNKPRIRIQMFAFKIVKKYNESLKFISFQFGFINEQNINRFILVHLMKNIFVFESKIISEIVGYLKLKFMFFLYFGHLKTISILKCGFLSFVIMNKYKNYRKNERYKNKISIKKYLIFIFFSIRTTNFILATSIENSQQREEISCNQPDFYAGILEKCDSHNDVCYDESKEINNDIQTKLMSIDSKRKYSFKKTKQEASKEIYSDSSEHSNDVKIIKKIGKKPKKNIFGKVLTFFKPLKKTTKLYRYSSHDEIRLDKKNDNLCEPKSSTNLYVPFSFLNKSKSLVKRNKDKKSFEDDENKSLDSDSEKNYFLTFGSSLDLSTSNRNDNYNFTSSQKANDYLFLSDCTSHKPLSVKNAYYNTEKCADKLDFNCDYANGGRKQRYLRHDIERLPKLNIAAGYDKQFRENLGRKVIYDESSQCNSNSSVDRIIQPIKEIFNNQAEILQHSLEFDPRSTSLHQIESSGQKVDDFYISRNCQEKNSLVNCGRVKKDIICDPRVDFIKEDKNTNDSSSIKEKSGILNQSNFLENSSLDDNIHFSPMKDMKKHIQKEKSSIVNREICDNSSKLCSKTSQPCGINREEADLCEKEDKYQKNSKSVTKRYYIIGRNMYINILHQFYITKKFEMFDKFYDSCFPVSNESDSEFFIYYKILHNVINILSEVSNNLELIVELRDLINTNNYRKLSFIHEEPSSNTLQSDNLQYNVEITNQPVQISLKNDQKTATHKDISKNQLEDKSTAFCASEKEKDLQVSALISELKSSQRFSSKDDDIIACQKSVIMDNQDIQKTYKPQNQPKYDKNSKNITNHHIDSHKLSEQIISKKRRSCLKLSENNYENIASLSLKEEYNNNNSKRIKKKVKFSDAMKIRIVTDNIIKDAYYKTKDFDGKASSYLKRVYDEIYNKIEYEISINDFTNSPDEDPYFFNGILVGDFSCVRPYYSDNFYNQAYDKATDSDSIDFDEMYYYSNS